MSARHTLARLRCSCAREGHMAQLAAGWLDSPASARGWARGWARGGRCTEPRARGWAPETAAVRSRHRLSCGHGVEAALLPTNTVSGHPMLLPLLKLHLLRLHGSVNVLHVRQESYVSALRNSPAPARGGRRTAPAPGARRPQRTAAAAPVTAARRSVISSCSVCLVAHVLRPSPAHPPPVRQLTGTGTYWICCCWGATMYWGCA